MGSACGKCSVWWLLGQAYIDFFYCYPFIKFVRYSFTFSGKEAHSSCLQWILIGRVSFVMLTRLSHRAVILIKWRSHQLKLLPSYFYSPLWPISVLQIFWNPFSRRESLAFHGTLVLAQCISLLNSSLVERVIIKKKENIIAYLKFIKQERSKWKKKKKRNKESLSFFLNHTLFQIGTRTQTVRHHRSHFLWHSANTQAADKNSKKIMTLAKQKTKGRNSNGKPAWQFQRSPRLPTFPWQQSAGCQL